MGLSVMTWMFMYHSNNVHECKLNDKGIYVRSNCDEIFVDIEPKNEQLNHCKLLLMYYLPLDKNMLVSYLIFLRY